MGNICPLSSSITPDAPKQPGRSSGAPPRERLPTTIDESEKILWKLRIPEDRFEMKIKQNDKEIEYIDKKVKDFVAAGNKRQAKFELSKKKIMREHNRALQDKLIFIQKQQVQIKQAIDNERFSTVVKESNKILSGILKKVDLAEIEYAQELIETSKQMQAEVNEQTLDQEYDDEIEDELNEIIAQTKYGDDLTISNNITFGNEYKNPNSLQTSQQKVIQYA